MGQNWTRLEQPTRFQRFVGALVALVYRFRSGAVLPVLLFLAPSADSSQSTS